MSVGRPSARKSCHSPCKPPMWWERGNPGTLERGRCPPFERGGVTVGRRRPHGVGAEKETVDRCRVDVTSLAPVALGYPVGDEVAAADSAVGLAQARPAPMAAPTVRPCVVRTPPAVLHDVHTRSAGVSVRRHRGPRLRDPSSSWSHSPRRTAARARPTRTAREDSHARRSGRRCHSAAL